jgi:hypothetical protein
VANYFRIHRIVNKFSVTHVREADDENLGGFVEVGRFDLFDEAMRFAADRGAVAVDFDVLVK